MNRKVRKAYVKYDKELTRMARLVTIRQLKKLGIDFAVVDDTIISTRNKDVENVYNTVMLDIINDFQKLDSDINKLRHIYDVYPHKSPKRG